MQNRNALIDGISAYYKQVSRKNLNLSSEDRSLIIDFFNKNFKPENFKKKKSFIELSDKLLEKILNSIVSTNFFLNKHFISFKLLNFAPNIYSEIFVYSDSFEGVHIRGDKISRGGIRWSDRDDYRVEILDLVHSQMLKNSIIVPSGAKGGFLIKTKDQATSVYSDYIRGLLDLMDLDFEAEDMSTQNIEIESARFLKSPQYVISYQEHDSYLVVAADRGTADFSDIANKIAIKEYNYWLSDAFASGGKNGFSHKELGITSKGCFESLKFHLKSTSNIITTIGIGDMSGDVFGNGLLLTDKYKLIAAFNHNYIFIDLNADPSSSFIERKHMFENKLDWQFYGQFTGISGFSVYSRKVDSITLSSEESEFFKFSQTTPDNLIKEILKLKVDLLWNGGIGTYCKSSKENHDDAHDKNNDNLRIDSNQLGPLAVIEGGNLGFTQKARIEASLLGHKINTDFIDNSGGVNCSDLEVNIKIFLNSNNVSHARSEKLILLCKGEVPKLVTKNNKDQNEALDMYEKLQTEENFLIYKRFAQKLIDLKIIDQDFLEVYEEFSSLRKNIGFSRPELSVILSGGKILFKKLLKTESKAFESIMQETILKDFALDTVSDRFKLDDKILISILSKYYPECIVNSGLNLLSNPIKEDIAICWIVNNLLNKIPGPILFEKLILEQEL